jgi:hypothetical protein
MLIFVRNHTAPAEQLEYGASWSEDLLFLEPVTECVDTNLTYDFELVSMTNVGNPVLVDHGGFININHTYPTYDPSSAQDDPQLAYRAYKGAWMNNAYTMLVCNSKSVPRLQLIISAFQLDKSRS